MNSISWIAIKFGSLFLQSQMLTFAAHPKKIDCASDCDSCFRTPKTAFFFCFSSVPRPFFFLFKTLPFFIFLTHFCILNTSSVDAAPKLIVQQQMEKTSVLSGEDLHGHLILKNGGNQPLKIRGVKSSCGCTTIRLKERLILPENEIQLKYVVDTRGKLGLIEKNITIYSNDPDSPHTEVMYFHALPSGMEGTAIQAVFDPPCAECHIDSGTGKTGAKLYDAIGLMCHPVEKLNTDDASLMVQLISEGMTAVGMPAYGEFLSPLQIQSLTRFITQKTK